MAAVVVWNNDDYTPSWANSKPTKIYFIWIVNGGELGNAWVPTVSVSLFVRRPSVCTTNHFNGPRINAYMCLLWLAKSFHFHTYLGAQFPHSILPFYYSSCVCVCVSLLLHFTSSQHLRWNLYIFNFIHTLFVSLMLLFVFCFHSFCEFFSCSPSIVDTYGTSTGGRMARYIATSCIFTGRRSFFTAGKHTRDWHRTFHSYQTCYDNTTKNFCYFAWTIRGKSLWMTTLHSTQCKVWNRAGKWKPK